MKFSKSVLIFAATILSPMTCDGFGLPSSMNTLFSSSSLSPAFYGKQHTLVTLSSSSSSNEESNSQSRLEGNRRAPTPNEIAIMDDMITKLANAKPYELPNAVSKSIRVVSSPQFFLRIVERVDMESSEEEKEKLSSLASNLVSTLEAVVSTTEDKLDERAKDVEKVLKAASEPDSGEFLVPLSVDRVDAMRDVLTNDLDPIDLDEGFLATVDAWMNKSMQDGMDGMVSILQKVLQIYAGTNIARARKSLAAQVGAAMTGKDVEETAEMVDAAENEGDRKPSALFLERILAMDTDMWDVELRKEFASDDGVTSASIMGEVQRTIEGVVLGLENGSMAQRVQAEYLRELVSRIEALEQSMGL